MGRLPPGSGRGTSASLAAQPEDLERLARALAVSGGIRILAALAEARRRDPQGGWMFLSEIAEAVGEAPGSVGPALQKLLPLLEEERRKGRRWFRSRVRDVVLTLEEPRGRGIL